MAAVLVTAAIGAWAVNTGQVSYVVTYGISMNPVYYADDLVILIRSDSYEVGQIAAYHGNDGQTEVLHRIIDGDGTSGYVLKGDNNDSVDAAKPTADKIIGRAVLHIPQGGTWLQPLLSPTGLGMLGFLFVSGGAVGIKSRRDIPRGRRRKRVKGMSGGGGSWATAAAVFKAVSRLHPALRMLAVTTAVCSVVGLALGVLGWMKPTTESVSRSGRTGESMTFAYTAEVPRSAAYDGTTVHSPDPVFRKLANVVDLHMNYRGEPGRIEISARLSSQNGWHKTLVLSQPKQFTTDRYTGKIQLDLPSLDQLVAEAGKAIGVDMGPTTLAITARVRHGDGSTFEPQVSFSLAPLQFTLVGSPEALAVDRSSTPAGTSVQDRRIGAFGYYPLTAAEARKYAVYLILVALIGAGIVAWMALGHVPLRTRTQIQRRYPHLIVPVEPMASPPGKPVVTVDTFPALVKLAEKYGQMILTWTRPDGADDFVVRDEGILYRYRIDPNVTASKAAPAGAAPEPAVAGRPRTAQPAPDNAPVMGLLPVAEHQAEVGTEKIGATTTGIEGTTTGHEAPTADTEPLAKKPTPRKRAATTTATKTAATKTAAAKAPASKTPGTRTPTKRTRATAKPSQPSAFTSDNPALAADLGSEGRTTETPAPAHNRLAASREAAATTSKQPSAPGEATAAEDSATKTTSIDGMKAADEAAAANRVADADEAKAADQATATDGINAADGVNAETQAQVGKAEQPIGEAESATKADQTAETGQAPEEQTEAQQPVKNQKASSRRKSRSRRTRQPASPEPATASTTEAREAMEDLAGRNTPMTTPEPGSPTTPEPGSPTTQPGSADSSGAEVKPVPWPEAGPGSQPDPPTHNREPFYDFLPVAKRAAANDVDDIDEPDA
ncbi:DUF5305 family protein [Actinoplanes sp. NPDC023801]|uniref:DUF5305 family protein n=1 Tax=Actinoplanes sp. NPDC023801 TaxID=3154595 RepID=UPI0033CDD04D